MSDETPDPIDDLRPLGRDDAEPTPGQIERGRARLLAHVAADRAPGTGRRRSRRAIAMGAAVAAAVVAPIAVAVWDDDQGSTPLSPAPAAAAEGLAPFADCDALRDWYVDAALERVTSSGLPGVASPGSWATSDLAFQRDSAVDLQVKSPGADQSPTGTNLQEAGVDEPDIVKTNGDTTVSIRRRTLVVTDTSGARPTELARLKDFRFTDGELLLVDDRVMVFSGATTYGGWGWDRLSSAPRPAWVTTVDLAEPDLPEIIGSQRLGGSVLSARATDGTVRIALGTVPDLPLVWPGGRYTEKTALARNKQVIEATTVEDWLPTRTRGGEIEPLIDCRQLTHPSRFAGFGATTIITVDPDDDSTSLTAVAGSGTQLYASTDRLYVATEEWRTQAKTDIHAFATDGRDTAYVASGRVDGIVPDRWAFDESDGVLRVASMQGKGWRVDQSAITTFAEQGDRLVELGSVGGLGDKNERIQAVRYFGDLAVLVTFRQVDPLYTVDLSDPAKPRKLGELKIPGFSAYLHPTGTDRVLGVGRQGNRIQTSLFDLSDLTRPTRVAVTDLTTSGWAWTPVEEDSRAFTWLPEQRLAVIPIEGSGKDRLAVVRVSADGLATVRVIELPYRYGGARGVPLGEGRIAVVGRGQVHQIVDLGRA